MCLAIQMCQCWQPYHMLSAWGHFTAPGTHTSTHYTVHQQHMHYIHPTMQPGKGSVAATKACGNINRHASFIVNHLACQQNVQPASPQLLRLHTATAACHAYRTHKAHAQSK